MGAGMTTTLRQMIQTADLQTLSSRLCKEHVREQFGAEGEAMICAHEQLNIGHSPRRAAEDKTEAEKGGGEGRREENPVTVRRPGPHIMEFAS